MNTPIMEFENEGQLQDCIEEWKKVLFLHDWIIKGSIVDDLVDDDGVKLIGHNEFQVVNKCSVIRLQKPNEEVKSTIVKYCAEETLVHELLHCKYSWIVKDSSSIEAVHYNTLEHGLIEQMAKSLIMAKYDLPFEWFYNF